MKKEMSELHELKKSQNLCQRPLGVWVRECETGSKIQALAQIFYSGIKRVIRGQ